MVYSNILFQSCSQSIQINFTIISNLVNNLRCACVGASTVCPSKDYTCLAKLFVERCCHQCLARDVATCVWWEMLPPVFGGRCCHLCLVRDVVTCVWLEMFPSVFGGRYCHLCLAGDVATYVRREMLANRTLRALNWRPFLIMMTMAVLYSLLRYWPFRCCYN